MKTIKKVFSLRSLFLLLFLSVCFQYIPSISLFGMNIRLSQVVYLAVFFAVVLKLGFKKLSSNSLTPFFVLFILTYFLGVALSENIFRSAIYWVIDFITISQVIVLVEAIRSADYFNISKHSLVIALNISGFLCLTFFYFQYALDLLGAPTSVTLLREHYTKRLFGFPRPHSFLIEPLFFANFISFFFFKSIVFLFSPQKTPQVQKKRTLFSFFSDSSKFINVFFCIFGGLSILLSLSRGAIFAVAIGTVFLSFFFLEKLKAHIKLSLPLISVSLIAIGIVFLVAGDKVETFVNHLFNVLSGVSFEERSLQSMTAIEAIRQKPFGIGVFEFGSFFSSLTGISSQNQTVNNQYLEIMVESGPVALGAFFIFLGYIAKTLFSKKHLNYARAGLGFFVSTLVQWLTFSTLYTFWVWFFLALNLSLDDEAAFSPLQSEGKK